MVKIPKREIDSFCRAPGTAIRAVLIYGPDQGLVRERSNLLLGGVVDDPRDPFRVCDLTGEEAARDPARLMEEAVSLSMTGGRRIVRVRGMADSFAPTMAEVLKLPTGDTLILVEAAELANRERHALLQLRQLGHVAALEAGGSAGGRDARHGLLALLLVDVRADDGRALRGEALQRRRPDAGRAAGHDRDLPVETSHDWILRPAR